jgi:hypothetical protein
MKKGSARNFEKIHEIPRLRVAIDTQAHSLGEEKKQLEKE